MSGLNVEDGRVQLSGGLTFATTPELYDQMRERLGQESTNGNSTLHIDLSEVTAADSSGLALLLEWQAGRRQNGGEIRIENAPANLLRLARLCEADELLNISGRENGQ